MKTVLDVENTVAKLEGGKLDFSPFRSQNHLVSVGAQAVLKDGLGEPWYGFFHHRDLPKDYPVLDKRVELQETLDKTTLLIGHNIKHDLKWLWSCGFRYDGPVFDTMIAEYVLARGQKKDLSLKGSAIRRDVQQKKSDLTEDYLKQGIGFDEIPLEVVEEYGVGDSTTTGELFQEQITLLKQSDNKGLIPTIQMMNEFCVVLAQMEMAGIAIDERALAEVEEEYVAEKQQLERRLHELVHEVMGDTPINLGSPEQLSQVIYGRKVNDKNKWKDKFNLGTDPKTGKPKRKARMKDKEFKQAVLTMTTPMKKTVAQQCKACEGKGHFWKTKKDGTPYKKPTKCPHCDGTGIVYKATPEPAGFGIKPAGVHETAVGGFVTNKDHLADLAARAKDEGKLKAEEFFNSIMRLNAISTYLSSFVGGIRRGLLPDGILHCNFNQTITATGRLSSSDPNFQNQPKGGKFPIRKCVVSRFEGGEIIESDYGQLEYRVAAELSRCAAAIKLVMEGVDAHQYTADVLTAAGQTTSRQEAKSRTFRPLYGGMSGTEAEVEYNKKFLAERHPGIGEWHIRLQEEVLRAGKIALPSGREYAWKVSRLEYKSNEYTICSSATQIKNYPVQGFATGDIVPLACIRLARLFKEHQVKSVLCNTVHDSIVVDRHPDDSRDFIVGLIREAMLGVVDDMKERWNFTPVVPLQIEISVGQNWLDTEDILKTEERYADAA